MKAVVRQVINRATLLVLLGLLGMLNDPAPVGAIKPLWVEAADLRSLKSYAAAVEVYEQIAALSPQDVEPLLAVGEIYLIQHRWPLAEDAFNRALARSGGSGRASAGLASAVWGEGDRQRAAALWEAALAREPDLPGVRVRLALAYLDLGRPADAEATLLATVRQSGESAVTDVPAAHLYLAMMQALDDTDDARRELAAIADEGPPAVVETRDYLLASLDKAETARSAAERAKSLGLTFAQIEEWQLARMALERVLALEPTDVEAMAFLGHVEGELGRPALAHLAAAVTARPDWPVGHYLLALYYLKQNATEFAAEELRVTLRLDPGNGQARLELARAYMGLGQYLAAEEVLVEAVKSSPKDLTLHLALVRFYTDHTFRIADRGLAAARAAATLAPDDARVRDLLGWMYFLAGDLKQAQLHLVSALRLAPELVSAIYHLGVLHRALGEAEAARFAFLRVVDLDADGFYRDRAQIALREMETLAQ